ncbi:MAG: hypothetical protein ACK4QP_10435 [Pseudorhizobium sp.]
MPKKPKRSKDGELLRLTKLKKAWTKASDEERISFLRGLPIQRYPTETSADEYLIANGRYLLPSTITRIERIVIGRRITPSGVATEVGYPEEGMALTRALAKGASLRLSIIKALAVWLAEQESRIQS